MPILESLLSKIVLAVVKKAAAVKTVKVISTGIDVLTSFESAHDVYRCVQTSSDCHSIGVCGVRVLSDQLTDFTIDHLVEIGTDTFRVRDTSTGIVVASRIVPTFLITGPSYHLTLSDMMRKAHVADHRALQVISSAARNSAENHRGLILRRDHRRNHHQ